MSDAIMDISNVNTAALMPGAVADDPEVSALLAVLDALWREYAPILETLGVLATIDRQPEEVVTKLAHQLHVDYWDDAWSLDVKRRVVTDSIRLHKIAGTRGAVEDVISSIWGDGAILSEWWEHGGEPGTFQVILSNQQTEANVEQFLASIRKVKRATDHLVIASLNEVSAPTAHVGSVLQKFRYYHL